MAAWKIGPALAAWLVVYRFTTDFSFSWVRNLIRGAVFAVLIGSKFVITADGISPVPLWQHALTGSAGFALVALLFWTVVFGAASTCESPTSLRRRSFPRRRAPCRSCRPL